MADLDAGTEHARTAGARLAGGASWPLIGRTAELEIASRALRHPDARGLIVAGAPGVGKTRLARELAGQAESEGFTTVSVVASDWTAKVPFGLLAPLLGDVPDNLEPTAALVWVRRWLLESVARPGARLLLAVDDAQLLDDLSAALVLNLAATGAATILATVRAAAAAPDSVVALWKDEVMPRLELQPLSRREVATLAEAVLAGMIDPVTHGRLWDASRGNPLLLREVLINVLDAGHLRWRHGIWHWNGRLNPGARLAEAIAERFGALSGDEHAVASLLAVCDGLPVEVMEALAPAEAIDRLQRRGVVEIAANHDHRPAVVRFSHPLYAETLRSRLAIADQRQLARTLLNAFEGQPADRAEDLTRIASLYLSAGEAGDPRVLTSAARHANAMGDVHLGERLARAALDLEPEAVTTGVALADALRQQRRTAEIEAVLSPLAARATTDAERWAVARRRADALFRGLDRRDAAEAVLADAEAAVTDPEIKALIRAERADVCVFAGNWSEARAFVYPLLDSPPSSTVLLNAFVPGVLCLITEGRFDAALTLCDTAMRAATSPHEGPAASGDHVVFLRLLVLGLAGHLQEVAQVATSLQDHAAEPWNQGRAGLALQTGVLRILEGDVAGAVAPLTEAVALLRHFDPTGFFVWALAHLAQARAIAGDAAAAQAALEEIDRDWSASHQAFAGAIGVARTWAAVAEGRLAEARELAISLADHCAAVADWYEEMLALHLAMRLGSAASVDRLAAVAKRIDGPLARAIEEEANGLMAGDAGAVHRAGEAYIRLGSSLLAAEAAARAAGLYRQAGSGLAADAAAERSHELSRACHGARTPALVVAATLTPREHDVVVLAAQGLSNREISDKLGLQVRTVEGHLNRAFAKLGVRARSELRDHLPSWGG